MSVALTVQADGLYQISMQLDRFGLESLDSLFEDIGGEVESQTRRRIQSEKASPGGEPWPAWSEQYARTRHGGHSLLQGEGPLLDSIQSLVEGDELQVGSNMDYAAAQNFGFDEANLPAREYLGLSQENVDDLEAVILHWVGRQLVKAMAS